MKAMILAAGFGTRLLPLTASTPKPLVPVANVPLIDRIISRLAAFGVTAVVVNAHHHQDRLARHLARGKTSGIEVEVRVEKEILGTGGGIKNTEDFWDDDPFVVVNGDILTDIDISAAFEQHLLNRPPATLVLHDCTQFNKIVIDGDTVKCIPREYTPETAGTLAFTGIQIVEPSLLAFIPPGRFSDIMDCYRNLMAAGIPVGAHVVSGHRWREIGTVSAYLQVNLEETGPEGRLVGPGSGIDPEAKMEGRVVLGSNVIVRKGACVSDSVIWDRVTVCEGVSVIGSIVTAGLTITEDIRDRAL